MSRIVMTEFGRCPPPRGPTMKALLCILIGHRNPGVCGRCERRAG